MRLHGHHHGELRQRAGAGGAETRRRYEARKARMKAFVANEKRPDILCDKDLYHFLRVFIDTGDWWQI
jgi:hypothetical protein